MSQVTAVAARFKVYEATQKTEADAIHFIYSLRPLVAGKEPFPAVPVSYFDVDLDQFAVLLSDPIPITVSKSEQLSGDQIVTAPRGVERTAKGLESRPEGIYADITDVAMARDQALHPLHWLIALGGCLGTYLLIAAITVVLRTPHPGPRGASPAGPAPHGLGSNSGRPWSSGRPSKSRGGRPDPGRPDRPGGRRGRLAGDRLDS